MESTLIKKRELGPIYKLQYTAQIPLDPVHPQDANLERTYIVE